MIIPRSPGARSGPSATERATSAAQVEWAPDAGGTRSGSRRASAPVSEQVRASCGGRGPGLGGGGLPDRRGRRLRLDAQAPGRRSMSTFASASSESVPRRAGSRTSRAAITPITRSGTGRRGSATTVDGRAGRLEPGQRGQRSARALRARDLDRRRAATEPGPVELRRARGDRASATARGSCSPPRPSAARARRSRSSSYSYRQPFGTFTGHPPWRTRARPRASASWSTTTPTGNSAVRAPASASWGPPIRARDRPTRTCQRHGGSSPGANSYWLRPSSVSSGTRAGTASSSSGVGASRSTSAALASRPRDPPSRASGGIASR